MSPTDTVAVTGPSVRQRIMRSPGSPVRMFASAWEGRKLIWRLAAREIQARYRGSILGLAWLILLPLLMLAVYTFAFSIVFRARWGATHTSTEAFALFLFAGLTVYGVFSESVNRAPGLVLENPAYVKKVVFPLELLPWVTLCVSLFNCAVSLVIFFVFYPFVLGVPPLTAVLLPLTLLPLVLVTLGICWFLASVGVFVRDVRPMIGVLTTAIMFLSPIFYPLEAVPPEIRAVLVLNPLAHTMEQVRGVLFFGVAPSPIALLLQTAIGLVIAWLGYYWFMRTRKAFADVL